jgi:hypothetical protein
VPDPERAPELWSSELSREPEFEQVLAESELELERERVESGLEQNLGLELEPD